jgi:ribosomal protein S1
VVQTKKKRKGDEITGKINALAPSIGLGMTKTMDNSKHTKIESVTFNKLNSGCLVLGYVLQVTADRVVVSLPGSSTGMVVNYEVSDVLYKMKMNKVPGQEKVGAVLTLVTR